MSEDSTTPVADASGTPSIDIRSSLFWGAIAAVVAGVLAATSSLIDAARGSKTGFSVSTALMLSAVVPQIMAVIAFARMTRSIDPIALNSLRRSGICVFGLGMVLTAAAALMDVFPNSPEGSAYVSLVIVGIGCAALFAYTFGGGKLPFLFAAYLVVRYLFGSLLLGKRVNPLDAFAVVSFLLLIVSLFAYPIWFANCLRRAKEKVGTSAVSLATALVLSLAVTVVFCIWMFVIVASAPDADRLTDDEIDALLAPHVKRFNFVGAVLEMAIAGCVASLFLGVRRRLNAKTPDA